MKPSGVTIADHFVSVGRYADWRGIVAIWRVVHLFQGVDGVPYARLVNTVDRSLTKTIATDALLDRTLFRQAG